MLSVSVDVWIGGSDPCKTWGLCFGLFALIDEGGPNVLLKKLIFAPDDHEEVALDLTGEFACVRAVSFIQPIGLADTCSRELCVLDLICVLARHHSWLLHHN